MAQGRRWQILKTGLLETVQILGGLIASGMDNEAGRELYERWRVPCVSLTIVGRLNDSGIRVYLTLIIFVGCDIRFYAIIAIAHRLRHI